MHVLSLTAVLDCDGRAPKHTTEVGTRVVNLIAGQLVDGLELLWEFCVHSTGGDEYIMGPGQHV